MMKKDTQLWRVTGKENVQYLQFLMLKYLNFRKQCCAFKRQIDFLAVRTSGKKNPNK